MGREIKLGRLAGLDIENVLVYLAVELGMPGAARNFRDKLSKSLIRLAELPELGRLISDDDLAWPYRRILVERYWVYYSYNEDTLTVWRVFHESQSKDIGGYGFWER